MVSAAMQTICDNAAQTEEAKSVQTMPLNSATQTPKTPRQPRSAESYSTTSDFNGSLSDTQVHSFSDGMWLYDRSEGEMAPIQIDTVDRWRMGSCPDHPLWYNGTDDIANVRSQTQTIIRWLPTHRWIDTAAWASENSPSRRCQVSSRRGTLFCNWRRCLSSSLMSRLASMTMAATNSCTWDIARSHCRRDSNRSALCGIRNRNSKHRGTISYLRRISMTARLERSNLLMVRWLPCFCAWFGYLWVPDDDDDRYTNVDGNDQVEDERNNQSSAGMFLGYVSLWHGLEIRWLLAIVYSSEWSHIISS